ncbi:MAG TPA: hypothetical protein VM285_08830 [Polyangia bacterium]|nr:hypothetical protein [Polyangia bacterium]
MDSGVHMAMVVSSGFSWMVNAGLWIGLLVVALTVVRRHRPDANRFVLWAALLGLLQALVGPGLGMLLSQANSIGLDSEAVLLSHALLGFAGTLLHAAVFVILLMGIIHLARPKPKSEG